MYFILMINDKETKEFTKYLVSEEQLAIVLSNLNKIKYQVEDIACIGEINLNYREILINNTDIEKG